MSFQNLELYDGGYIVLAAVITGVVLLLERLAQIAAGKRSDLGYIENLLVTIPTLILLAMLGGKW